uniref:Uncharacterized protein isoform X1 n=1 Tax=Nicotiana tabacum TaxID=4097 RepID=A0A1S4BPW7_TOBAC|nr:PREDICTED: uncharacterized protein LOC107810640 isoform X1 [Nicotiana tabacum]
MGVQIVAEVSTGNSVQFLIQKTMMQTSNSPASSFRHTIMPSLPQLLSGRILHFAKLSATSSYESHSTEKVKFPKKISRKPDSGSPPRKTQKLNLEVSPHRAVSAVRLMRIELGGAFADLLNEQGKGSGDNEMGYVERTLGFRTRHLEDRDLRLVTEIVGGTIRWRRYLDHLILSLCHDESTFRSMEPLLLQILRIGFYEITKLDMPPYAVVDEVRLVHYFGLQWLFYFDLVILMKLICRLSRKMDVNLYSGEPRQLMV